MLTATDIRQLSNADIAQDIEKTQDLVYRQSMGVQTGHLKDSHTVGILKKHLARLKTTQTARRAASEDVESNADAAKKLATAHADLAKKAEPKKKAPAKAAAKKVEDAGSDDVKVKKVEKKGLLDKITGKKSESKES